MTHVTVGRWGKNLAVRFPGDVVSAVKLHEGEQVAIDTRGDEIVIRRLAPRFSLEELFHGRSPEEWRNAYANAFEWGPDIGREIVDE